MADKMMRMAGRSESGIAKAVKTDDEGSLVVSPISHMADEITMIHGDDTDANLTHNNIDNRNVTFYPGFASSTALTSLSLGERWIDGSKYKKKQMFVRNTYNGSIRFRLVDQIFGYRFVTIAEKVLEAGEDAIFDAVDYPRLNEPYQNLLLETRDVDDVISEGSIFVKFRGWE